MQIAFLPVPDKFVGQPMPLEEAINFAAFGQASADTLAEWNDDDEQALEATPPEAAKGRSVIDLFIPALVSFKEALQSGDLPSYLWAAQWYSVPRFHWNQFMGSTRMPEEGCQGVPNATGWDESMRGAALVVWRAEALAWAATYREQLEQQAAEAVEPVAVRTGLAGRTNTVEHAKAIMTERASNGELLPHLSHEVAAVNAILRTDPRYSSVPKAEDRSLGNGLRQTYNRLKSA